MRPPCQAANSQRVRLAKQIGSKLSGVLYIFDEPSIGLHQKDNAQLLQLLKELRDAGNSILIVEHDPETILSADYVVDMGPGAGSQRRPSRRALDLPSELMAQRALAHRSVFIRPSKRSRFHPCAEKVQASS